MSKYIFPVIVFLLLLSSSIYYFKAYHELKVETEVHKELAEAIRKEHHEALTKLKERDNEVRKLEIERTRIIDSYEFSRPVISLQPSKGDREAGHSPERDDTTNEGEPSKACGLLLEEAFQRFGRVLEGLEDNAREASLINNAYSSCYETF